jgi:hypothetical protein
MISRVAKLLFANGNTIACETEFGCAKIFENRYPEPAARDSPRHLSFDGKARTNPQEADLKSEADLEVK